MAKISVFGMNAAYQLGFERIMDVRGVRSISHLFKKAEFLSGIYLQIRPGNHAYIGKTYNLPARFEQHIARGVVIEELAFKPMRANIVDKIEKQCIALAERKGIAIDNIALREKLAVLDSAKFDEVLDEETRKAWLAPNENKTDNRPFLKTYDAMHPGLRLLLDKARAHPVWPQVFPVAKSFIEEVIPKLVDTRGLFWNANAYTTQVDESFIPLIKVYAGSQNILGLGFFQFAPFEAWGWVNISQSAIEHIDELEKILPFARIEVKDKIIEISASVRFLPYVVQKIKLPLRTSTLALMQTSLLQNGNPALEVLLTER